jgi:two-component sensor histidine kinase
MNLSATHARPEHPSNASPAVLPKDGYPFTSPGGETLLMREFTHRVTNDWSSAISAVSLAARRSDDPEVKSALGVVIDRLYRHAQLFRALQMPQSDTTIDAADYLERLCLAVGESKLDSMNIRLVLAADPLAMRAERCWRLGMIVMELVTNAARHAFQGRDGGTIRVDLFRTGRCTECRVIDNGSVSKTIRPGTGLTIVKDLAGSLGGTIKHRFGRHGSSAILRFAA